MTDATPSHLENFSWLIPGRLAGMALPRSRADLAALQTLGIRQLVSLFEHPLPEAILEQYGLTAVHVPITDYTAPTVAQAAEAVAAIERSIAEERPVAVHCAAGLGRTGTILACYLVARGAPAEEAIAEIRARRPGSIETAEQEAAVAAYAGHVAQERGGIHRGN